MEAAFEYAHAILTITGVAPYQRSNPTIVSPDGTATPLHSPEDIMDFTRATVTIAGTSPYSQSRAHNEPFLEGESHDAYDRRTWRFKQSVRTVKGKSTVVIPAHGLHQAIIAAAKYSKRQIPGQGKATWTAKLTSGIAILESPALNVDPTTVQSETISANSDGVRGSGKRVPRMFPVIPEWQCTFEVAILDPILTQDVFRDFLELAGLFIGIGRFRPEKGGTNGRFVVSKLQWQDNRRIAA
jgi:hypothetical protein